MGQVTGEIRLAREAEVDVDGKVVNLLDAPGVSDRLRERARSEDEDTTEMVVPVDWEVAVAQEQAVNEPGLFASQVTVCKLRDERTIELVARQFGLDVGNGSEVEAATASE